MTNHPQDMSDEALAQIIQFPVDNPYINRADLWATMRDEDKEIPLIRARAVRQALAATSPDVSGDTLAELRELLDALMENRRKDAEWLGRTASKVHRLETETIPAHDDALADLRWSLGATNERLSGEQIENGRGISSTAPEPDDDIRDALVLHDAALAELRATIKILKGRYLTHVHETLEREAISSAPMPELRSAIGPTPPAVPDAGENDEKWWSVADAARDTWIKDQVDDRDGWLLVGAAAVAKAAELGLGLTITTSGCGVTGDAMDVPEWVDVITIHYTEDDEWQVALLTDADSGDARRADGFGTTRQEAWRAAVANHVPAGNDQDDTHGEDQ